MTHYKMRYADRKMDDDAARDVLDAGDFCVVSTVDTDGAPYGVPLSYVRVGDALYLHSAIEARAGVSRPCSETVLVWKTVHRRYVFL